MAKHFESSRGRSFTREEIEDLPYFNMEEADHDAWLEYENEHGISPDEVQTYMKELEQENIQALGVDEMVDARGQKYEQLKFELDEETPNIDEAKKKSRVSERLSNIKDKIQFGAWQAANKVNEIPEKMSELKDKAAFKLWQAQEETENIMESSKGTLSKTMETASQKMDDATMKTAVTMITKQDEVLEMLAEKHRLVAKNIEAKERIRDFAEGELSKEELAYLMANDTELKQSIGSVSHSMLHPSPIKGLKTERTNLQLDIGYGFSVFMEELRQPAENEVEAIMEIDNMNMLVEMGQDKTIPPTVRENYFREAGVSDENMEHFVTRDDYRDYVTELEQKFRQQHITRLGLADKDTLDIEDENMIQNLVDDSMSLHNPEEDAFEYLSGPAGEMENTYQQTYQMSAEDMFQMFDSPDNYQGMDYDTMQFPQYVDYDFEGTEFMRHSVEEYHALQDMSIQDSQEYLQSIEAEMRAYEAQMEVMDEQSIPPEMVDEQNALPVSNPMDERNIPPELSDADLANLEMQEPPMLSDEDLAMLDEQVPPEPELNEDDLRDLYNNQNSHYK